jgi:uncharacterized membrane protein (DUF485 family)
MYTCIFKNSYVASIITFIILYILFYMFEIGYTTDMKDGRVVKRAGWKYPLAITLIVWVIIHFYVYPPHKKPMACATPTVPGTQKINMYNWN